MNPRCRSCGAVLTQTLIDLGEQPLANSYPASPEECEQESRYPLHVRVCQSCWLVQLPEVVSPDHIFSDYAYFSSYSDSWVEHARQFADSAISRWDLDAGSLVVEIASNDGYLLQHFAARGIPVLGIEPAANVAEVALSRGIPTRTEFFTTALATQLEAEGIAADVIVGNNVLAHVPELNDFISGVRALLRPSGVASFEFPQLLAMFELASFDTIYHEHFSYFSLLSVETAFQRHRMRVVDVELLPTHGGSYRVSVCHEAASHESTPRVEQQRGAEAAAGLGSSSAYQRFAEQSRARADSVCRFLDDVRGRGERVAAYGAAAKGNTLLNYCSVSTDDVAYVVDRNPHKQGLVLPGSHLPIRDPAVLLEDRPDHLLILPWNLSAEIREQVAPRCDWNMSFVTTVPHARVLP